MLRELDQAYLAPSLASKSERPCMIGRCRSWHVDRRLSDLRWEQMCSLRLDSLVLVSELAEIVGVVLA